MDTTIALKPTSTRERTRNRLAAVSAVSLALFAMAGAYKTTFQTFDATLVFWLGAVVSAGLVLIADRSRIPGRGTRLLVVLFLVLMLPMLFSDWDATSSEKQIRLASLTFLSALVPQIVIRSSRTYWWFVGTLAAVGGSIAVVSVARGSGSSLARLSFSDSNTILTARAVGIALVIVATIAIYRRHAWPIAMLPAAALAYVVIGTGSRGPVLAVILAIILSYVIAVRPLRLNLHSTGWKRGLMIIGGGVAVVAIGIVLVMVVPEGPLERIESLVTGQSGADDSARQVAISEASSMIASMPQGIGWGNFTTTAYPDIGYPHNIVLEIFAEAGWVAGLLFLVLIAVAFRAVLRPKIPLPRMVTITWVATTVFVLANALVSADVNGNKLVFIMLSIGLSLGWGLRPPETSNGPAVATISA